MTGYLSFEFNGEGKTLTRARFAVDVQTRYGNTTEEIWETYEKAEKAYRFVRDEYGLRNTKSQDYTSSKEYEAEGSNEAGLIECHVNWFKGSNFTVTNFWIDFHPFAK